MRGEFLSRVRYVGALRPDTKRHKLVFLRDLRKLESVITQSLSCVPSLSPDLQVMC